MEHFTEQSEAKVVEIIVAWPGDKKFGWEELRLAYAKIKKVKLDKVWTRQSLKANAEIYEAYLFEKARRKGRSSAVSESESEFEGELETRIDPILTEKDLYKSKYEKLLARHNTLIYNITSREGFSVRYLFGDMPDNTSALS